MTKKYKYVILCIICFFLCFILLSFSQHPVLADSSVELSEDGTISITHPPEITISGEPEVEIMTVEELRDIYLNRPEELPQDDDSLNAIREIISEYESNL